ncbi:MAG TPA: hypothetical protein VH877_02530 [Polyangia bacterium]|jgi:hypothetical protein|nr:hypothetical protein [Polyangia bacterium]
MDMDIDFRQDPALPERIARFYGDYQGTYRSRRGQVQADLFRAGRMLVAYIGFAEGLDPEAATDTYLNELQSIAKKLGFENKLRLVYA